MRAQLQQQNMELEAWRSTHELDMEAAKITQQAILPARAPQIPGWESRVISSRSCRSAATCTIGSGYATISWLFWIADATGHGASAALLTTLTKLVFRHAASESEPSPSALLKAANREFHSIFRGKSFMTAACLIIDQASPSIRFAGAGHPPLLLSRAGGGVEFLPSQGPPWGFCRTWNRRNSRPNSAPRTPRSSIRMASTASPIARHAPHPKDIPALFGQRNGTSQQWLCDLAANLNARANGPLPDDLAAIAIRRVLG